MWVYFCVSKARTEKIIAGRLCPFKMVLALCCFNFTDKVKFPAKISLTNPILVHNGIAVPVGLIVAAEPLI